MDRALALAVSPDAPRGVNPRVGCVIVDADGRIIGEGYHRGAGTPHAEVEALRACGAASRGATAIVTLEPCRHHGRTGPCTQALIDAGVARVVFAQTDPTEIASGGAGILRDAGIEVIGGVRSDEAATVNRLWSHVQATGRPWVTVKTAVSLDGQVADAGGGPTAITGPEARSFVHDLRTAVDAIAVGTGTVNVDDPQLTARHADGRLRDRQPLRVVIGSRALPGGRRVLDDAAPTVVFGTRDLTSVLADLAGRGVQHLLVEGGPTLSTAFLDEGLVDDVIWLIAPRILGPGPVSVRVLDHPRRIDVRSVRAVGDDVAITGAVHQAL